MALERRSLATAILAGFGRTVSEVGAILVVAAISMASPVL
jgi:ABC-type tungstate transport system substrate-binding protein